MIDPGTLLSEIRARLGPAPRSWADAAALLALSERSPLEWGLTLAHLAQVSGELDLPLRLAVTALIAQAIPAPGPGAPRGQLLVSGERRGALVLGPGLAIDGEGRMSGAAQVTPPAPAGTILARATRGQSDCGVLLETDSPGAVLDANGRFTASRIQLHADQILPIDARALTARLMARAAMAIVGCIQAAADRCVAALRAGPEDLGSFHEPHVQASLGRLHAALAGARFLAAEVLEREPQEWASAGWRRQAAAASAFAAEQALAASQELGRWAAPGCSELQDAIRLLVSAAGALGPPESQLIALTDEVIAERVPPRPHAIAEEVERRFGPLISDKVNPGTVERDRAGVAVPRALLEEAGALGLLGYSLPVAIGGEGRDLHEWGLVLEALGRSCLDGSFTTLASLYGSIAESIHDLGREDLDQLYVRPMVQGRCLGGFSYTEDADPFSFRSLATRTGDGWVLKGDKKLITGGLHADIFIVYVGNGAGDLLVFLVRRDDPGVTVRAEPTMGLRAAGLASLSMDGVRLGAERLLVGSDGLGHAQRYLNRRRVLLVCPMVGAMRAALDGCVARLGVTERYGAPLLAISSVRSRVGRMAAGMDACRATLHRTLASMRDAPPEAAFDVPSALAKYLITREAVAMGESLLRLMGTEGYREGPWEKFLRDAMALLAAGGTQDLLEVALGAELAREWELRAQRISSVKTA